LTPLQAGTIAWAAGGTAGSGAGDGEGVAAGSGAGDGDGDGAGAGDQLEPPFEKRQAK